MLFDVPTDNSYQILTHSSTRRFQQNGFSQVGNELFPKNPIAPQAIKTSAIYNKNISGISEAGFGQRFPYYGLSRYAGAGSPRNTVSVYTGAGSPRGSVLSAYTGAGSPRGSVLSVYTGAGSPRGSVLADAYVNDNPPPGSLNRLSGLSRAGVRGRLSTRPRRLSGLYGLADDTPAPVDTGTSENLIPPSTSDSIFSAIGNLFGSTVQAGSQAIDNAIGGGTPTPVKATTTPGGVVSTTPTGLLAGLSSGTLFGISTATLMMVGVGLYLYKNR